MSIQDKYPIDGTLAEKVAYLSGLDEHTLDRLGGFLEQTAAIRRSSERRRKPTNSNWGPICE